VHREGEVESAAEGKTEEKPKKPHGRKKAEEAPAQEVPATNESPAKTE
jgi:hypothetical protein